MKVNYLSSTQNIQLKENSTKNSAEKNLKEDSKFNELWNFSIKQKQNKKKEKYSNSKNFVSWTLSDKFPANCTKIATLDLLYPFRSCFFA